MKSIFKSIVKTGLTFGIAGVLLAVAAPYVAVAMHFAPTLGAATVSLGSAASPAAMGAFFAVVGAIDGAIEPMLDKLFGAKNEIARTPTAQERIYAEPAIEQEKAPGRTKFIDLVKAAHGCGCDKSR